MRKININDMVEIWKDIVGYEGLYQISSFGRVKSLKFGKERILSTSPNGSGYLNVVLCKKGFKPFNGGTHRLVALHFIDNPENKEQVNHIDGCKTNNKVENLEWNTSSENTQHSYDVGLSKKGKDSTSSKIIYQYTLDNIFIKKWDCIRDVQRELNIKQSNISVCAKGKVKTAGGFRWSYDITS